MILPAQVTPHLVRRRRQISVERLRQIATKAVVNGYGEVIRPRVVKLNLAMDCEEPYAFELFARSRKIIGRVVYTVIGESRCRKCFSCVRRKSLFWTGRAVTEFLQAPRTWFGTLTLSPEEHFRIDARAQARLWSKSVDWRRLSAMEQFEERAKEVGLEMTNFIKRLRKGNGVVSDAGPALPHLGVKIRYLLIAEQHDSVHTSDEMRGRPHYHMLIHEQEAGALVVGNPKAALLSASGRSLEMERRHYKTRTGWKPGVFAADEAFIRRQWKLGYTKFQMADSANSAVYVCKYLTKALHVRVRASQGYGRSVSPEPRRESGQNDQRGK